MAAVDRPIRAPEAGLRAPRPSGHARMLWALCASALVHLWMVGGIAPGATRIAAPFSAQIMEARLERLGASADPPAPAGDEVHTERAERLPDAARAQGEAERESSLAELRTGAPPNAADNKAPAHELQRSASAPADPVYSSARELDDYPTPAVPLRIAYPAHAINAPVAGNVLVSLRVNETGTVDQVAVVAAEPPGFFEEHTRTTLASARFNPGRREGQAVKSQVTVRVTYDPATRAGALQ